MAKKGQNIGKFRQKCAKFENILKKGSLMRATIARIKQLEYALERDFGIIPSTLHYLWDLWKLELGEKPCGLKRVGKGICGGGGEEEIF